MFDFVVAIENRSGRIIRTWKGEKYRSFNPEKVSQYRIATAKNEKDAEDRALSIHQSLGR